MQKGKEIICGINLIFCVEIWGNDGINLFSSMENGGRNLGNDGAKRVIRFVGFDCAI